MEVIDSKNSFGRPQIIITLAICYSNFIGVWQTYCVVFMTISNEFRCVEPDPGPNGTATCEVSNGSHLQPCTRWEYQGPRTLISEWDLVCDRAWLVSMAKSVYMIGFLFAVISFGQLSDLIGRYRAMWIGYGLSLLSMYITLLSTSYIMFLVLNFFQAFGRQGMQICSFVLLTEVVGVKHRNLVGIAFLTSWSIGASILPAVAWCFKDWFWFQLVITLSFSTVSIAFILVSESPRWTHMKYNQNEEDGIEKENTYKEINAGNLEGNIDDFKEKSSEEKKQPGNRNKSKTILDIFKTPKLRKRILIMYYMWPASVFMYYALLFNTNDLAGDPYLNFSLASSLDLPAYATFYWAIGRFGRRPILTFYMAGGAASCIARIAAPQDVVWLQTSLWMVNLACATSSLGVLYLYSSELFPTVVRNVAVGSCSSSARVGAILAPFVKEIGNASRVWVPPLIYGSMCLIGSFLALLLPETKGQNLKDTLQEMVSSEKSEENGTMDKEDLRVQENSSS